MHAVRHRASSGEVTTSGRRLVKAADGGILLETSDHQLVTIKGTDVLEDETTVEQFVYLSGDELGEQLQQELGEAFTIVRTRRYVIATNAGASYGRWCGRFLERLQVAFIAYWKKAGLELVEPADPLPVIIFSDPKDFATYAAVDAGAAVAQSQGYYSIRSNRVILTDLTNIPGSRPARSDGEILRRVEARVANFTTVIHEAAHQIAFNCGLHTRYADNPMWLLEGMAMYCEAPDFKGSTGWKSIGRLHSGRLAQFQDFARQRRLPSSLASLIMTDDRFRDPKTAVDAYAESWTLTYFLMQKHRDEYVDYLRRLQNQPRLVWLTPEQREAAFLSTFETSWETIEAEFKSFCARLDRK
ncbi:MAG: DUF1570 domain-containing protein [Planctomycetaceae bacterium]